MRHSIVRRQLESELSTISSADLVRPWRGRLNVPRLRLSRGEKALPLLRTVLPQPGSAQKHDDFRLVPVEEKARSSAMFTARDCCRYRSQRRRTLAIKLIVRINYKAA